MVISKLSSEFPMSDLGPLSFFLGIVASRSKSGFFLSQSAFAQEILARADMVSCNPCNTPADTKTKLAVDGEPVPDPTLYRSLVGALQYLTFTRPDIAYAVHQVCLFMHDPRLPHLNALKRILRYLKGTLSHGLHLKASAVDRLVAYSNADWAGCPTTRRSTSGFCVYLGDNLVSWSSKRQHVVSRSSAEAEYRGIANVVAETAWLRNLLLELCCPLSRATVVFCDNVSAMYLASNPVQHQRTKHVEIDLHFVRERVAIGHVRVLHVLSAYQYADIFTKGLPTIPPLLFLKRLRGGFKREPLFGCERENNREYDTWRMTRRHVFWGGTDDVRKICWLAWNKTIRDKSGGGLGIGSLRALNLALLVKWRWRELTESKAKWLNVVRGCNDELSAVASSKGGVWNSICGVEKNLRDLGINLPTLLHSNERRVMGGFGN
ncbi:hypothetical protein OSB04_024524 [Centaurea solstitialis]|uniref:Reverse transcriptase Ty1/copia-type domain-containing protein n=1 Tax=Centaurea solstitialis TaxID=347529 RepID=A0AA38W369_9ASTR|nr:hypothetical protein OSB04_024524 [Centaurea solstitialis]